MPRGANAVTRVRSHLVRSHLGDDLTDIKKSGHQPMRYAIYFTPNPATQLHAFGCGVLGYDADRGERIAFHAELEQQFSNIEALTAAPRRYGFHATLKAPFALANGTCEDGLLDAVAALADGLGSISLGRLHVIAGRDFIGLRPHDRQHPAVRRLAQSCVERLDGFRAPLTDDDRARRQIERLTPRHRAQLERWGYPFIGDDFECHMTLIGPTTGPSASSPMTQLETTLRGLWQTCPGETVVDALTVARQDKPDRPFYNVARFKLAAAQM